MKYLIPSQIESAVRIDHPIEQLIGAFKIDAFRVLRWISIERSKDRYQLLLHEVFDDSDEGIESIYHFSYVEPDDIHGKVILTSESLAEILSYAEQELKATDGRYLNFGLMDQELDTVL